MTSTTLTATAQEHCIVHANKTCGYLNSQCSTLLMNNIDILDHQFVDMSDYIYCLIPYGLALPLILLSCCSRESIDANTKLMNLNIVYVFLLISFTLRCFWLFARGFGFWDIETRVIQKEDCSTCLACTWATIPHLFNRVAVLTYFTAYTCVCKIWLDVWANYESKSERNMSFEASNKRLRHHNENNTRQISTSMFMNLDGKNGMMEDTEQTNENELEENNTLASDKTALAIRICGCNITLFIVILNVWMYIIEFILEFTYIYGGFKKDFYSDTKDWNHRIVSSFFLILGILFTYSGMKLIGLLKRVESKNGRIMQCKILFVLIVILLSFSLRAFMFLARPAFNLELPKIFFPYFFYPVPELVPTFMLLYLTSSYTRVYDYYKKVTASCIHICPCCYPKVIFDERSALKERLIREEIHNNWIANNNNNNNNNNTNGELVSINDSDEKDGGGGETLFL